MDETQRLNAINELIARHSHAGRGSLTETHLDLIFKEGSSAAFARNSRGQVAGFKFAGPPNSQEILDLVFGFPELQRLIFFGHSTVDIPAGIIHLKRLQFLLFEGRIRSIPEEILQMELPLIVLGGPSTSSETEAVRDRIKDLQSVFHKIYASPDGTPVESDVEYDKLSNNKKYQLARGWDLVRGFCLDAGAELEDPPMEIAARGREALLSYYRDRESGSLQLNEVKVLLVGHGSCGKTSLVKRLLKEKFDPFESQTHGISIRTLAFGTRKDARVKANFWDFGGQEIMHATHQFFLSKRSLYILVLDGRKEEDAEYWLQHIQSFGGDSPILIALNKIDENPSFDLNRLFLSDKYPNIVGYQKISCATEVGLDSLKKKIHQQLTSAAILQTKWPRSWIRVKRKLQQSGKEYISLNDYHALCVDEGVEEPTSQEALVEFLHDLGTVLHFKDLQLLDTHVLDPRWVTEGVYRIINSKLLAKQKGYMELHQLGAIFAVAGISQFTYPPEKYSYIIELMLKFELCYRLDSGAILVPDLLSIQQPDLSLEADSSPLRFAFDYQYLPKSVMPRLTVRMHQDIKEQKAWRTGVILHDKALAATALVRSDDKAKRIDILVIGKQKRDYFSVIRKVITDINTSFEKLLVTEFVPLPDEPSVMLEYRELIGHELMGKKEITVGKLRKDYSVGLLLDGIEDEKSRASTSDIVINVQGNYNHQQTTGGTNIMPDTTESRPIYDAPTWEKIVAYSTAVLFVGAMLFLLIRNQPIADKNLVVVLRVILSVMVAVFGGSLPGMLHVEMKSTRGITIRATGALGLFVLSFLLTPKVLE